MHNMTEQQIKDYLLNPGICPFCQSSDIEGGSFDVHGNNATQDIECLECREEWTDEHTLTGVI